MVGEGWLCRVCDLGFGVPEPWGTDGVFCFCFCFCFFLLSRAHRVALRLRVGFSRGGGVLGWG
jgi:hypothetical protein